MLTREDALAHDYFHYGNCTRSTGPRGGVKTHTAEVRRNGQNKLWKSRPDDFRVPLKYGYRGHGEIVPANLAEFHLPEDCPLLDGNDHTANETHTARVQPVTVSMLPGMVFYRAICTCGFKTVEERSPVGARLKMVCHEAEARGNAVMYRAGS